MARARRPVIGAGSVRRAVIGGALWRCQRCDIRGAVGWGNAVVVERGSGKIRCCCCFHLYFLPAIEEEREYD